MKHLWVLKSEFGEQATSDRKEAIRIEAELLAAGSKCSVEHFVQLEWKELDPQDPATWPPAVGRYLGYWMYGPVGNRAREFHWGQPAVCHPTHWAEVEFPLYREIRT